MFIFFIFFFILNFSPFIIVFSSILEDLLTWGESYVKKSGTEYIKPPGTGVRNAGISLPGSTNSNNKNKNNLSKTDDNYMTEEEDDDEGKEP